MSRLRFLGGAKQDLRSIFECIGRESGSTVPAHRFVGALREKCRHLAGLPGRLGNPRPSLGPDTRSFAFRGYIIVFHYEGDTLEVIRILEGHRDIEHQLQEPDGQTPP